MINSDGAFLQGVLSSIPHVRNREKGESRLQSCGPWCYHKLTGAFSGPDVALRQRPGGAGPGHP